MDKYGFSEVLTLNCKDMKICGSLFFIQLSKLTFGTRLSDIGLVEPNYLPFSLLLLNKSPER